MVIHDYLYSYIIVGNCFQIFCFQIFYLRGEIMNARHGYIHDYLYIPIVFKSSALKYFSVWGEVTNSCQQAYMVIHDYLYYFSRVDSPSFKAIRVINLSLSDLDVHLLK